MTTDDLGFVLHTRPYRETSQLVTLFTSGHGRLNAVSRASRQRRGGNQLRPFCPLRLSWRGRTDLKTLDAAEAAAAPLVLTGEKLFVGLYLNELLARLLHEHDPCPPLFERYHKTLELVVEAAVVEPVLRFFELTLLEDLGYGLRLDVDMDSGEPVTAGQRYLFFPGEGVRAYRPGEPVSHLFRGEQLLAIAGLNFDSQEVLRSAKRLARLALEPYLGNKPLASRELFRRGPVESTAP
ncbi:MAG: DNA repair protein RecO [Bacteroidales bacterium]|nr:DNA repair protein RecO [Bacteroidales bacterium]